MTGSCGVEYRLVLTDEGLEKYGGSFSSFRNSNRKPTGGELPCPFLLTGGKLTKLYSRHIAPGPPPMLPPASAAPSVPSTEAARGSAAAVVMIPHLPTTLGRQGINPRLRVMLKAGDPASGAVWRRARQRRILPAKGRERERGNRRMVAPAIWCLEVVVGRVVQQVRMASSW